MKRGSTLLLKIIIYLIGIGVLAFCIFVLPNGVRTTRWDGYRPLLLGMYVSAVPFFIGLCQGLKLLRLIDKNKAFSEASVRSLQIIKYCGIVIGVMYGVGMPYIFNLADMDDAPGVVLIGLFFTFAPILVAIIATILQRLLSNAIAIKSENELIV
jgi:hypothetical protein